MTDEKTMREEIIAHLSKRYEKMPDCPDKDRNALKTHQPRLPSTSGKTYLDEPSLDPGVDNRDVLSVTLLQLFNLSEKPPSES